MGDLPTRSLYYVPEDQKVTADDYEILGLTATPIGWSTDKPTDLAESFSVSLNPPAGKGADKSGSGTYLTVGTGSQILRDLGVRQMRLLSSPRKFSVTGFDLETVEFIPYKGAPVRADEL